jgi:hypothetical protein
MGTATFPLLFARCQAPGFQNKHCDFPQPSSQGKAIRFAATSEANPAAWPNRSEEAGANPTFRDGVASSQFAEVKEAAADSGLFTRGSTNHGFLSSERWNRSRGSLLG